VLDKIEKQSRLMGSKMGEIPSLEPACALCYSCGENEDMLQYDPERFSTDLKVDSELRFHFWFLQASSTEAPT
jgi:hypothetical protein